MAMAPRAPAATSARSLRLGPMAENDCRRSEVDLQFLERTAFAIGQKGRLSRPDAEHHNMPKFFLRRYPVKISLLG